jgi:hypothetical protein
VWFSAALVVGALRLLAALPIPPPAIIGALTLTLLVALASSASMRRHVRSFGIRSFVAFHITRVAAGAYFLVLYSRGALPAEFALPAGWGDIAVGIGALIVAVSCIPLRSSWQQIALLTWNAFGLVDILFVLSSGIRLFLRDAAILSRFMELPLSLLPTFVVPIVLVSHVLIFIWWRDAQAAAQ